MPTYNVWTDNEEEFDEEFFGTPEVIVEASSIDEAALDAFEELGDYGFIEDSGDKTNFIIEDVQNKTFYKVLLKMTPSVYNKTTVSRDELLGKY